MLRMIASFVVVLALTTVGHASLHTYNNSPAPTGDVFTMIGTGDFSLADTAWLNDANSTRYLATSGFSVQANGLAGNQTFDLYDAEIWPAFNNVTLEFRNTTYGKLWIDIVVPGLTLGQAVPNTLPGLNYWKTANYLNPGGTGLLRGELPQSNLSASAVPEPSAFLLGGLVMGLVGVGRWFRSRQVA